MGDVHGSPHVLYAITLQRATLQQPSLTVLFPRQDSGGSHGTITGHVLRLATWSAVQ